MAEVLGETRLDHFVALSRLRHVWPDILGPMMAARTEPVNIEPMEDGNNRLWIAVNHSAMAQQIRFLRDEIRKACSRHCGIYNLVEIRTKVQADAGVPVREPVRAKTVPLSVRKRLASDIRDVKDKRLRLALYQARVAQLAFTDTNPLED
jgi:hypothetical protein